MDIIGFFNCLFHPKPKGKIKLPAKKATTTQEAAAMALNRLLHSERKR